MPQGAPFKKLLISLFKYSEGARGAGPLGRLDAPTREPQIGVRPWWSFHLWFGRADESRENAPARSGYAGPIDGAREPGQAGAGETDHGQPRE
jgi:hypothetical protein